LSGETALDSICEVLPYSNLTTKQDQIDTRLDELAPLYDQITGHGFGNLVGDALEIIVEKCLLAIQQENPRYQYQGHFHLDAPKDKQGRYQKTQPPKTMGARATKKEADFFQFGHAEGALCIECKNYREWVYPHHGIVRELVIKASDLDTIPVLITRRLHYMTKKNLLEPAGIIAHETYYQYYPADQDTLAQRVKHKRSLGFTDVLATETPHARTMKFFRESLPKIVGPMADAWNAKKHHLRSYADGEINLAQLYTEIDSPAGGKWQDFSENPEAPWE
jgi:hypothetical protein